MNIWWVLLGASLSLWGGTFEGWTVFSVPPEGVSPAALAASYRELRKFAQEEKIGRIVYLVRYNQSPDFFDPQGFGEENFVYLLSSLPLPCELELMFDGRPCSYRGTKKAKFPDQYLRTNFSFADLKQKLIYFSEVYKQARGAISGLVLNPEGIYFLNDLQKAINYLDAYLHVNSISHYIKKGLVLSFHQEMFTFINRSRLPIEVHSILGEWIKKKSLEAFPLGERPLWRKNDPSPLIDHVYVNICSDEIPYLLEKIGENPSQGATAFLSLLSSTPYKKGEGVIKFTQGGKEVQGKNTSFLSEILVGTPLGAELNGVQACLCPDKSPPSPPRLWMNCESRVIDKPQSNSLLKLSHPASISSNGYVPYYIVESLVNYRSVPVTEEMIEGISWMFNFKPSYFGRYSHKTLSHFTQELIQQGKNFGVFKGVGQSTLPFPGHFSLVTFETIH
jgi:hypothetical protein